MTQHLEARLNGLSHADWNDQMSRKYDPNAFHHHPCGLIRWVEEERVRAVIQGLHLESEDQTVLEVGCGAGNVLEAMPRGQRFGVDLSGYLLERARQRLGPAADLRQADGEELPFENDRFDRVYSTEVLEHTMRPERVVAEMLRVTRPGGRVVMTVPNETLIHRVKTVAHRLGLDGLLVGAGPDGNQQGVEFGHEWHLHELDAVTLKEYAFRHGAAQVDVGNLPPLLALHYVVVAWKAPVPPADVINFPARRRRRVATALAAGAGLLLLGGWLYQCTQTDTDA